MRFCMHLDCVAAAHISSIIWLIYWLNFYGLIFMWFKHWKTYKQSLILTLMLQHVRLLLRLYSSALSRKMPNVEN